MNRSTKSFYIFKWLVEQDYSLKSIQGILVHVLSYRAKGAFQMSSCPNLKLSDLH